MYRCDNAPDYRCKDRRSSLPSLDMGINMVVTLRDREPEGTFVPGVAKNFGN